MGAPRVAPRVAVADWFADPGGWKIDAYLFWGFVLALVMLVAGYFIGLLWQRWRDDRKAR